MAIEVSLEDDVLFADLNRQISLLIDEDDDVHVSRFTSRSYQEYPGMIVARPPILPSQYDVYQANRDREMSKGTGVFIPQSCHPRRRYKPQGKRASSSSNYASKTNKNIKQVNISKGRSNVIDHTTTFSPPYATNINEYQDY